MSEERRKVLELLAAGTISAEEAERLLDKLGTPTRPEIPHAETTDDPAAPSDDSAPRAPLKYLRVLVDSADGDNVNVRVPIALVRTGINLATMMPAHAGEKLEERGIDLSHLSELDGEELIEALRELQVDVNSSDGDTVRVFCE
jgi:hypothetical protein